MEEILDVIKKILNFNLISFDHYQLTVLGLVIIIGGYFVLWKALNLFAARINKLFFIRGRIDSGRQHSIVLIVKYAANTIFILFCLQLIGINLSLVLTGSAALLVGLGFGIQSIFNDLVSGVIILFEGNVDKGDIVDAGGLVGEVEKLGIRTSHVRTREGVTIAVPNSKFVSENVINWTHEEQSARFMVGVGVAYGSDVQLVKELLLNCAKEHPDVASTPSSFVRFVNFGNSSLDFELYFWSEHIWVIENIKSDLRFAIDATFREHKITIPFPQRDVHMK
ncbi:MAG: mechanosensitive ion channel family protein [Flammeovirgaceae bacterium]